MLLLCQMLVNVFYSTGFFIRSRKTEKATRAIHLVHISCKCRFESVAVLCCLTVGKQ